MILKNNGSLKNSNLKIKRFMSLILILEKRKSKKKTIENIPC